MDRSLLCGTYDHGPGSARLSDQNIARNTAAEQMCFLCHVGFRFPKEMCRNPLYVLVGDPDPALLDIPEAHEELQHRRFSGSALTMDPYDPVRPDEQREVFKDHVTVVCECDAVDLRTAEMPVSVPSLRSLAHRDVRSFRHLLQEIQHPLTGSKCL